MLSCYSRYQPSSRSIRLISRRTNMSLPMVHDNVIFGFMSDMSELDSKALCIVEI